MGKPGKRIGRPTKAPKSGERVPLGLRVTAETKRKLDAAAKKAVRSQSQEAEFRLEQSFNHDDTFGGPELRRYALLMAAAFSIGGSKQAHPKQIAEWINDRDAFAAAVVSVLSSLLKFMPDATPEKVAMIFESVRGRIATEFMNDGLKK